MDKLDDMDEELAKARKVQEDADGVDIYKYRRRYRLLKAVLLGAALAGLVSMIMAMIEGKRNPCERVRDYLCKKDPAGLQCKSYDGIVDDSVHEASAAMRSQLRAQCVSKIERLKEEENVTVP